MSAQPATETRPSSSAAATVAPGGRGGLRDELLLLLKQSSGLALEEGVDLAVFEEVLAELDDPNMPPVKTDTSEPALPPSLSRLLEPSPSPPAAPSRPFTDPREQQISSLKSEIALRKRQIFDRYFRNIKVKQRQEVATGAGGLREVSRPSAVAPNVSSLPVEALSGFSRYPEVVESLQKDYAQLTTLQQRLRKLQTQMHDLNIQPTAPSPPHTPVSSSSSSSSSEEAWRMVQPLGDGAAATKTASDAQVSGGRDARSRKRAYVRRALLQFTKEQRDIIRELIQQTQQLDEVAPPHLLTWLRERESRNQPTDLQYWPQKVRVEARDFGLKLQLWSCQRFFPKRLQFLLASGCTFAAVYNGIRFLMAVPGTQAYDAKLQQTVTPLLLAVLLWEWYLDFTASIVNPNQDQVVEIDPMKQRGTESR
ncbi:unnamed protein product [Vitrella brassicaformis CCMP3155]|uniref:Uncharacterized protein n=1 Tax=Vitrella brassicaformis (strain CCMP3155) TaxID=1169540 RepID=A0A0G4EIY2_VITBC|nr:unnamed protein product [Vitrella brassicaformis CCMP3155]|eukprot:CEL95864.1 unnamed protein product [Vitrella brassicaformis CCMP3155]